MCDRLRERERERERERQKETERETERERETVQSPLTVTNLHSLLSQETELLITMNTGKIYLISA